MDVLFFVAFFTFGLIVGVFICFALTIYIGRRALVKRKTKTASIAEKAKSISSRMNRVKEITNQQLDLYSQISGPQKNSLHGKHKNNLNGQMKELDDEKAAILNSILADGFDPEISVMDGAGVITKTKLSNFMTESGIAIESKKPEPKTKPIGRFTVHKGGKDDDDGNTTH